MPHVQKPISTPPPSARNAAPVSDEVSKERVYMNGTETACTPRVIDGEDPLQGDWKSSLLAVVQQQHDAFHNHLDLQCKTLLHAIEELLREWSPEFHTVHNAERESKDWLDPSVLDCSYQNLRQSAVNGEKRSRKSVQVSTLSGSVMTERSKSVNHDIDQPSPSQMSFKEIASRDSFKEHAMKKVHSIIDNVEECCPCIPKKGVEQIEHLKAKMDKDSTVGEGIFHKQVGRHFDSWVGVVILLNTVVLMVQLQWQGYEAAVDLGYAQPDDGWDGAQTAFFICEHIFNGIFFIELLIRLWFFRLGFFVDATNLFDLVLVLFSSVDLYILAPMKSNVGSNISFLRIIRLAKLMRVLRLVRVLTLFRNLRILVKTIAASAQALLWSMVLVFIIIVMSGIFMCQLLERFIKDKDANVEDRKWAFLLYGSSSRAMYTMFEATLSGCWPNYSRRLVEEVSPWYAVFFIFYITGVSFAVVRIITALFLRETLMVANNDADMVLAESCYRKNMYVEKLKAFFQEADQSGDGCIDFEEFEAIMANPKVKVWLSSLELEVHESNALFQLLDDGDGQITYDEFLKGVIRLKGQARAIDVVCIMHDMSRLSKRVEQMCQLIEERNGSRR